MARGTESKEKIIEKILETFPGAFRYDKELRIPMTEAGDQIQIKVTLTCAKTNVENEDDTPPFDVDNVKKETPSEPKVVAPSAEERQAVQTLIEKLGLA